MSVLEKVTLTLQLPLVKNKKQASKVYSEDHMAHNKHAVGIWVLGYFIWILSHTKNHMNLLHTSLFIVYPVFSMIEDTILKSSFEIKTTTISIFILQVFTSQ